MPLHDFVVVDVGNSRIKWGLCVPGAIQETASLPPEESAWQEQLAKWPSDRPRAWLVSGVHPTRRDALANWLQRRGQRVVMLASHRQLPIEVELEAPDKVGIDRLLNAVATNSRRRADKPAIVVDAGSAVTVDYIDRAGRFTGGAILPGIRMMAQSLHDHTALLPLVEIRAVPPALGRSTTTAIESGVFHAIAGGINCLIAALAPAGDDADLFIGGGDGSLLAPALARPAVYWEAMTLTGMRLTAEGLL
jgi:type III pantothenate kinase